MNITEEKLRGVLRKYFTGAELEFVMDEIGQAAFINAGGMGLTRRQWEALGFITAYMQEHSIAPSHEEIAAGLNIKSKGAVNRLLDGLEQRGRLRRIRHRSRAMEVIQ